MPDTYTSQAAANKDRAALEAALSDLDISPSRLRLDECRLWTIRGRNANYISTAGDRRSFVFYLACKSALAWTWAKKRLAFMRVVNDGEEEGVLRFSLPLSDEEAEEVRALGGFRVATTLSPERKAALAAALSAARNKL